MNTKKNCGMHAILDGFLKYRSKGLYKEFQSNNGHCDVFYFLFLTFRPFLFLNLKIKHDFVFINKATQYNNFLR